MSNSTDATQGLPIVERVQLRLRELQAALAALPADDLTARNDLAIAIDTAQQMLTGDLDHVAAVVVADMSRWLEDNKYLAQSA